MKTRIEEDCNKSIRFIKSILYSVGSPIINSNIEELSIILEEFNQNPVYKTILKDFEVQSEDGNIDRSKIETHINVLKDTVLIPVFGFVIIEEKHSIDLKNAFEQLNEKEIDLVLHISRKIKEKLIWNKEEKLNGSFLNTYMIEKHVSQLNKTERTKLLQYWQPVKGQKFSVSNKVDTVYYYVNSMHDEVIFSEKSSYSKKECIPMLSALEILSIIKENYPETIKKIGSLEISKNHFQVLWNEFKECLK